MPTNKSTVKVTIDRQVVYLYSPFASSVAAMADAIRTVTGIDWNAKHLQTLKLTRES